MPIITAFSQSESELLASCRGVPTPFIPFEKVEDGHRLVIHARFYIKKRGGALHVRTADQSDFGGRDIVMRSRDQRYWHFIRAAEELTRAFHLDPAMGGAANPNNRHLIWNKATAAYRNRDTLIRTISTYLLNVVDPKRGRPASEPRGTPPAPDLKLGRKGARRARKNALLDVMSTMQHLLGDPIERLQDARRMAGYTDEERARLRTLLLDLRTRVQGIQKEIHDDTLVTTVAELHPQASAEEAQARESRLSFFATPLPSES
jgi:hypothetical protein